jgi:class 3 adenylate cyclase/tetratricopeptide (TPR) repeat protein
VAACRSCGTENADTARFCQACGGSLDSAAAVLTAPPPHEVRKTVTILFADVAGSTALGERLDPEALRSVMSRYYAEMRAVLESHGGTVEKFIGDAVMAVFGAPVAHEDDALRAVRAADEMRNRLVELNTELERRHGVALEMRIGVNTGQVVAGDPSAGQALVTGDAVNLAKRLEQAAPAGSILIGKATYPLVKDAVAAGPLESFKVKGKAEPIAPLRLDAVDPHAPGVARGLEKRFVGRVDELAALEIAFRRVEGEQSCRLFTLLGPAGIGKSRLVAEFAAGSGATVLQGRCLPYGEGITLWPFREIVDALGGADGLAEPLAGIEDAELVAERVAVAVGAAAGPANAEDTPWAFRRLLEAVAQGGPVVVVLEDLHWAAAPLLDLVEYLLGWLDAPVFLVCVARPDLVDVRPAWLNPRLNADSLVLQPLVPEEAEALLDALAAAPEARARIAAAAEGNPLFLEQMAAMLAERPREPRTAMPPSIQALLAARLDQLDELERTVIECAAVVGREFSRAAVGALAPPQLEQPLGGTLMALVRKELLVPESSGGQDDVFRFGHILIRDAAYDAVPKRVRAQLHEQLARWLEERGAPAPEETVGYHLEQAYFARSELGQPDESLQRLAGRAAAVLASAGRRALSRDDLPAAVSLLERAAALLVSDPDRRGEVLVELGLARREAGQLDLAASAFAAAEEAPSEWVRWHAALEGSSLRSYVDPGIEADELLRIANGAIEVFDESDDELGLARAWLHIAEAHWLRCHCAKMEEALAQALVHAERAGARREIAATLASLARPQLVGPRPVADAMDVCKDILRRGRGSAVVEGHANVALAVLEAMTGRVEAARRRYQETAIVLEDRGLTPLVASLRMYAGMVELLGRDAEAAERELRRGYDDLGAVGHSSYLATTAAFLARPLYELGRHEEAFAMTLASEEAASPDDIASQVVWRGTRAKLLARRGDTAAVNVAQEGVELVGRTDLVNIAADAHSDLAEALRLLGRNDEAAVARDRALELYEAKGNLASAAAMRET